MTHARRDAAHARPHPGELDGHAAAERDRPRGRQQRRHRPRGPVEIANHARARRAVADVRASTRQALAVGDTGGQRQQIGLQAPAPVTALVLLDQHAQLRSGTLGNLPVLLDRPSEARTELADAHVDADLAGEHELLVAVQIGDDLAQASQLSAGDHPVLDGRAAILQLAGSVLGRVDGDRAGERRLDRAAPADRPATVLDAAQELLLERVLDVLVGEKRRASRAGDQLESGLAVAVLEVLPAQTAAMDAEQPATAVGRNPGHLLSRIATHVASRKRHRGLFRRPGRHRDSANAGFHKPVATLGFWRGAVAE